MSDVRAQLERLRPVYETGVLRLLLRNHAMTYVALLRTCFKPLTAELPKETLEVRLAGALEELAHDGECAFTWERHRARFGRFGGIICPIRWDEEHILLEDIIKKLDLGVLVISNAALGSINNCVLTISYLKQKNIPVRGIILNNYDGSNFMQADNKRMMEEITAVPVLACVPPNASELDIDVEVLKGLYK